MPIREGRTENEGSAKCTGKGDFTVWVHLAKGKRKQEATLVTDRACTVRESTQRTEFTQHENQRSIDFTFGEDMESPSSRTNRSSITSLSI